MGDSAFFTSLISPHFLFRGSLWDRSACSDAVAASAQPRHVDGKAISERNERNFPVGAIGFSLAEPCPYASMSESGRGRSALPVSSQLARLASARALPCAEMFGSCTSPARSAVDRIGPLAMAANDGN